MILYLKCGGGLGGGCNVFLPFYAISNISRKKPVHHVMDAMTSGELSFKYILQGLSVPNQHF